MTGRHEVALASTTASSGMIKIGEHNCGNQHDINGGRECYYVAEIGHNEGILRMRDDNDGLLDARDQRLISLSPSIVVTVEGPLPTTSQTSRTSTISSLSTRTSPSSSSFSSSTHKFTPTGYQTIVPTYPPFSFSSSSSSSSSSNPSNTTNWASLATKLGLGLGIPILVLLVVLLTILLHRRQARLAKLSTSHYYHHQQHRATFPEMTGAADTRLHPAPSSRFSTAGSVVVTPAPGINNMPTPTMTQLYFPPSPSPPPPPPPPPAVPKRNSARLLFAGPLNSHPPPPPPAARPASSIFDEGDNREVGESVVALGGNGVGNVLSQYLDTNSAYSNGPWDPGQMEDVPALPLPLKTIARARQEGQTRHHLSVNVDHSPGGIEEVSPLSSSGSGPYIPARISGMSGMSPVSPGRTRSRRRK